MGFDGIHPLVMSKQLGKIAIEIVDIPIEHGDLNHREVINYQRVDGIISWDQNDFR